MIDYGCRWVERSTPDGVVYDSSCQNTHEFMEGGPIENKFDYCPYCGCTLIIIEELPEIIP